MYQNIILPVELGNIEAYREAKKAASALLSDGGKITLLHSIEPIPAYVETYIPQDLKIESQNEIRRNLKDMSDGLGVENHELLFGSAGRSIVDWATAKHADCIVIASHKPELSDIFLGSTASWVVRHAQTNVLVLR